MLIFCVEEGLDATARQSGNQSGKLWLKANVIIRRTMLHYMILVLNIPGVAQGAHPSAGI
jgi:hypothetical protein